MNIKYANEEMDYRRINILNDFDDECFFFEVLECFDSIASEEEADKWARLIAIRQHELFDYVSVEEGPTGFQWALVAAMCRDFDSMDYGEFVNSHDDTLTKEIAEQLINRFLPAHNRMSKYFFVKEKTEAGLSKDEVLKENASLTSEEYDIYLNLYHNDARIRSFYNNAFGFDWNNEFFVCANTDFLKEVSGYYAFVPKKQPKLSRKAWHAIVPSIATKDYLGIWSF